MEIYKIAAIIVVACTIIALIFRCLVKIKDAFDHRLKKNKPYAYVGDKILTNVLGHTIPCGYLVFVVHCILADSLNDTEQGLLIVSTIMAIFFTLIYISEMDEYHYNY